MPKIRTEEVPARLFESAPYIAAALALTLAALFSGKANAQSFACADAQSQAQLAICNSEDLLVLDEKLSAMVSQRRSQARKPTERQALATEQAQWLASRDLCRGDLACLELRYRERMAALAGVDGLAALARIKPLRP
jgi:uncharacterized protein